MSRQTEILNIIDKIKQNCFVNINPDTYVTELEILIEESIIIDRGVSFINTGGIEIESPQPTIRQQYKMVALNAFINKNDMPICKSKDIALNCGYIADAMIEEDKLHNEKYTIK
jgi:hypothetical protein